MTAEIDSSPPTPPQNQPLATATAALAEKYADYFDRIICINLDRRKDRWDSFTKNFKTFGWCFKTPQRFRAIDGEKVPTPPGFEEGGGAWGCLQGHRQILEAAIMDDVKHLLVLEDDAYLTETSIPILLQFLEDVPQDWQCLMLGGQDQGAVIPVKPGVVKVTNVGRTHAYAIRGQFLRDLYAQWCSPSSRVHCDWIMGPMLSITQAYAPDPTYPIGQEESRSDISGNDNPRKNWSRSYREQPVILLRARRPVMQAMRYRHNWHNGRWRHEDSDIDMGLIDIYRTDTDHTEELRKWIRLVGDEADNMGGVLVVWHPEATADELRQATSREVVEITAASEDDALKQWREHRGHN